MKSQSNAPKRGNHPPKRTSHRRNLRPRFERKPVFGKHGIRSQRGQDCYENGLCQVMKDRRVALSAKKRGGVFWVMTELVTGSEKRGNDLVDYHPRCGHTNYRVIQLMSMINIMPPIEEERDHVDDVC